MAVLTLPTPTRFEFQRIYRIPLDGVQYTFRYDWNVRANCFFLTLGTNANIDLLRGLAMLVNADILRPYRALAVPQGVLSVVDTSGQLLDPQEREDFGDRVVPQYTEVDA